MLKRIFENEDFILYYDNKGYDFVYDIENKRDTAITIKLNDCEETFTINDWRGLFDDEQYVIDSIIKNDYEIVESEEE